MIAPLVGRAAVSLVPEMQRSYRPPPGRVPDARGHRQAASGRSRRCPASSLEVARGESHHVPRAVRLRQDDAACASSPGLETQDRGRIVQNGRDISRLPAIKRDYGIVFQSYALFPNLTIYDNVAYGLVNRRAGRARDPLACRGAADAGRAARRRRQVSGPALRRAAAADRARARAGDVARAAAARRAAVGARCAGARTPARRDPRAAAAPGRDDHHGHARSGGSAVDGRHGRGDEPGPHRAGRHAATDLPRTGVGVRRRLRRQGQRAERGRRRRAGAFASAA